MKNSIASVTLALSASWIVCSSSALGEAANKTSSLAFVKEYIRELTELEDLRVDAETALKQKDVNPLDEGIHTSTRIQLALRMDIGMLQGMHLGSRLDFVPAYIINLHKQKIDIHDRLIAISTEFMSGPKPGVDYGKLGAEMPKLRAILESIDESFLKLSAMVFMTLIDEKPDKNNHMSRLTITSAERQDLLDDLKTSFGSKLDQKEQKYLVGAADVLRLYLRKDKGYKCTDEP